MTTQEKIDAIIKDQYGDFKGKKMQSVKTAHAFMRYRRLTFWQMVLYAHGYKVTPGKKITDEQYLEFLEKSVKENQRPVYQYSKELQDYIKNNHNEQPIK
jgi:hypothetical protein